MDKAIQIINKMIEDLQKTCPANYTVDNDYTIIQDKIELLNQAIINIKKEMN